MTNFITEWCSTARKLNKKTSKKKPYLHEQTAINILGVEHGIRQMFTFDPPPLPGDTPTMCGLLFRYCRNVVSHPDLVGQGIIVHRSLLPQDINGGPEQRVQMFIKFYDRYAEIPWVHGHIGYHEHPQLRIQVLCRPRAKHQNRQQQEQQHERHYSTSKLSKSRSTNQLINIPVIQVGDEIVLYSYNALILSAKTADQLRKTVKTWNSILYKHGLEADLTIMLL